METIPSGEQTKCRIYDTAGQERFHTITSAYYNHCQGVAFTFALNDKESFDQVSDWVERFGENADATMPKILIGNKADLDRTVSEEDAKKLAAKLDCEYFETSAKTATNVNEAFKRLFDLAYATQSGGSAPGKADTVKLGSKPKDGGKDKKGCAC